MAYLGNSPLKTTVLRLEARKSFSLALWFKDHNGRQADLTGCSVSFVMKRNPLDPTDTDDSDNLVTSSSAEILDPLRGYCVFNIQASELDLSAGEYPFTIVLQLASGYSVVAVKGVVDVQANTEFASMLSSYDAASGDSLEVRLRGEQSIDVFVGASLPPGFTWMSDADKAKIDVLSVASSTFPQGGVAGQVLRKISDVDYEYGWVDPQTFDGTLSAEFASAGQAPIADGVGSWTWQDVATEEGVQSDWNATSGPAEILNKPTLGTAAAKNEHDFVPFGRVYGFDEIVGTALPGQLPRVLGLQGISRGTAAPSGGVDGDIYLQYL